ncbi:MAG: hypothetical protein HYU68_13955 [Bacteroidetes bacterium]|nr:hypothetical protein [Bacteroidota bacterium]
MKTIHLLAILLILTSTTNSYSQSQKTSLDSTDIHCIKTQEEIGRIQKQLVNIEYRKNQILSKESIDYVQLDYIEERKQLIITRLTKYIRLKEEFCEVK